MQNLVNRFLTAAVGANRRHWFCRATSLLHGYRRQPATILLLVLCHAGFPTRSSADALPELPDAGTPLQQSRYQSLPTAPEIDAYLRSIADGSENAKTVEIGRSVQNRPLRAVLISSTPAVLATGSAHEDKLTVMLVGSQHPSEASGAEALQILARELIEGDLRSFLDTLNVVIIADSNPDGRELKTRTNANRVNLSTDYLLLSQPESRSLVSALRTYQPHALVDLHESALWKKSSLGAEGYMTDFEAQLESGNQANIDGRLQSYALDTFLPGLIEAINSKGLPAARYTGEITSTRQPIEHGGFTVRNLRNYSAYRGTLSILIENRIDPPGNYPSYRNIQQRTKKQYLSVVTCLEQLSNAREKIADLDGEVRRRWQDPHGGRTLFLHSAYIQNAAQPFVTVPLRNIQAGRLESIRFANHTVLEKSMPLTLAPIYAVTGEQAWVAPLLDKHGIGYERVEAPRSAEATVQKVTQVSLSPKRTIHGRVVTRHLAVDTVETPTIIDLAAGDLLIDMEQPMARLIVDAFDPRSSSSIFHSVQHTMLLLKYEHFFVVPVTTLHPSTNN